MVGRRIAGQRGRAGSDATRAVVFVRQLRTAHAPRSEMLFDHFIAPLLRG